MNRNDYEVVWDGDTRKAHRGHLLYQPDPVRTPAAVQRMHLPEGPPTRGLVGRPAGTPRPRRRRLTAEEYARMLARFDV